MDNFSNLSLAVICVAFSLAEGFHMMGGSSFSMGGSSSSKGMHSSMFKGMMPPMPPMPPMPYMPQMPQMPSMSMMPMPPPWPLMPPGASSSGSSYSSSYSSSSSSSSSSSEAQCNGILNYIAESFNSLAFMSSISYHDSANFRTLFEYTDGSGWNLYDFNDGRVYNYRSGECTYYENSDAVLSVEMMNDLMTTDDMYPDFLGNPGIAYTVANGNVNIRGVLTTDCVEAYTFIEVDGVPKVSIFHDNFQTANVDSEINSKISAARTQIVNSQCVRVYGI